MGLIRYDLACLVVSAGVIWREVRDAYLVVYIPTGCVAVILLDVFPWDVSHGDYASHGRVGSKRLGSDDDVCESAGVFTNLADGGQWE